MTDTAQTDQQLVIDGSPGGRQAFGVYMTALNEGRYQDAVRYYQDDIVLERPALPPGSDREGVKFVGKDEVIGYFSQLFTKFREVTEVPQLIADSEGICAKLISTFTPLEDASDFEPMPLKMGESVTVTTYGIYTLRNGKICRITLALP